MGKIIEAIYKLFTIVMFSGLMYTMIKANLICGLIIVCMIFLMWYIMVLYGYIMDKLKQIEDKLNIKL